MLLSLSLLSNQMPYNPIEAHGDAQSVTKDDDTAFYSIFKRLIRLVQLWWSTGTVLILPLLLNSASWFKVVTVNYNTGSLLTSSEDDFRNVFDTYRPLWDTSHHFCCWLQCDNTITTPAVDDLLFHFHCAQAHYTLTTRSLDLDQQTPEEIRGTVITSCDDGCNNGNKRWFSNSELTVTSCSWWQRTVRTSECTVQRSCANRIDTSLTEVGSRHSNQ